MLKKITAFSLAALLVLGMTGCSSGNNVTSDGDNFNNHAVLPNGGSGVQNDRQNDLGEDLEDTWDDVKENAEDLLTGDRDRYQDMLENGRVHDSDGYLLDGENRHD